MHELIQVSVSSSWHFVPVFHEGEGNFELYVDLLNNVGGFPSAALSLFWAIGALYWVEKNKNPFPFIAFSTITHLLVVKANIPVFVSDLGLTLLIYGLAIWAKRYVSTKKEKSTSVM